MATAFNNLTEEQINQIMSKSQAENPLTEQEKLLESLMTRIKVDFSSCHHV